MSLSIIAIIGSLITGILAYISHLRTKVVEKDITIASMKNAGQNKEWDDAIKKVTESLVEKEIDYKTAADNFRNKHGSSDGSGGSGGQ